MNCMICGRFVGSFNQRRKHDLAYHYDYVLAQCGGNHEALRKWASEDY
ncbi:MAG: hypothetical protein HOD60_08660 [Candidatus Nitrosopelagicus sp.]|jgi:hypothetical protein|nr:hypothetical protein [Candidatus Nitrosopelagicus sp.]